MRRAVSDEYSIDAAANRADANPRPTGVAISKPPLAAFTITPGVARAWRKRNPAATMNAYPTSRTRASFRMRAALSTCSESAMFTPATPITSQKWLGRCCHVTSSSG